MDIAADVAVSIFFYSQIYLAKPRQNLFGNY